MGSVYRCHNALSAQVQAAVKVLTLSNSSGAKDRFVRELEVLASLDHPNIVRVLGGGVDVERSNLYLVMELVQGRDLTWYIEGRPLPWTEACRIVRDVASALAEAHAKGVHHRDLKPANIMLGDDGKVKLIDFGIALAEGQTRLTHARGIPGTMSYMPPEVFNQATHDPALGDIYSLGVVLHEALVGIRAYPEDPDLTTVQRFANVMGKKSRDEFLDPGESVSDALRELVKAATHRDPTRRIGDAAAMAEALDQLIQGEDPGVAPTPAPAARRPKSTEDTFTLDADRVSRPPPPPKKKARVQTAGKAYTATTPRLNKKPRGFFPFLSLFWTLFLAVLPPIWVVFWFIVAVLIPELGVMVLALTILVAPLVMPMMSFVGLTCTAWFSVRVWSRSRMPLLWLTFAFLLAGAHVWHIGLAVADGIWMVALAQQAIEEPEEKSWRDFIPK